MRKQLPPISAPNFMHGYWADARGRRVTELAPPSVNLFLTSSGSAVTRAGYEDTGWDLNNAGHAAEPLWLSEYNVTFFAFNNKVICVDHDKSDAVYDTGLTLTAESTISQNNGAVYVTNPTDGMYRIGVTRLDAAALAAAVEVFVEDGTVYRFEATGTLRIKGTAETYSGRDTTDWKFTGMTLTQGYASGDLVLQTKALSSGGGTVPYFKKVIFWEEAMHGFGPQTATSNQTAKRTVIYGKFGSAAAWTDVEAFTGGASGTQVVGKKGVMENLFEIEDFLYAFTSDESYSFAVADINRTTGARLPHIFSRKYTCQNTRTAAEMDGNIVFVDLKKKRIIRSKANLAGELKPDELFDAPMRNLLRNMDPTQTNALMYYWEEANYLLCQLSIDRQTTTLIYDNNPIICQVNGRTVESTGRWLPPVLNWTVKNYFTKTGRLHGTDLMDDTVYEFAVGQTDDGGDIDTTWAAGTYEIEKGRAMADWGTFEVSGGLSRGTTATFAPLVSETEGKTKEFDDTGLDFGNSSATGSVPVGIEIVGAHGTGADFANFDKSMKISPAKGRSFQPVISTGGDGQALRVDSWRLPKVKYYGHSLISTT